MQADYNYCSYLKKMIAMMEITTKMATTMTQMTIPITAPLDRPPGEATEGVAVVPVVG